MYRFPTMEESWEAVGRLLRDVTGRDCSTGVRQIREIYQHGKWAALGRYFGPDGRIVEQKIAADIDLTWNAVMLSLESEIVQFAWRLAEKRRFRKFSSELLVHDVRRYLNTFLRDFTLKEIAENRTRKGPAVSTLISKDIDSYENRSGWICFEKYSLCGYDNADIPLFKEFVQIVFSRVVELVRPLLSSEITIVLSINPLDLLAMSEFTTGWSSCLSLYSGEYRAGAIAYVCDSVTAIAFAYQTTSYQGKLGLEYPTKMWRQLVHFDLENLSAAHSRHYPSLNPELGKEARRLSARVLSEHGNVPYEWWCRKPSRDIVPLREEEHEHGFEFQAMESRGWVYADAYTAVIRMKQGGKMPKVPIGFSSIPCVICGKPRRDHDPHDFICSDCGGSVVTRCKDCYDPIEDRAEALYYEDDGPYCPHCFFEHYFTCERCGDIFPLSLMRETATIEAVCHACFREHFLVCDVCDRAYEKKDVHQTARGKHVCKDCAGRSSKRAYEREKVAV